jgi:hypothetical protein
MIRQFILDDTAAVLDTAFLSTNAASAVQPAGISNGLGANDVASVGNTLANIQTDLRGMLGRMATLNMGMSPTWIMHPLRQIALSTTLTATGTLAFPSVSSGSLMGAPIIASTSCPQDQVFLIDQSEIAMAGGNPMFDYSNVATLHEEGDPAVVASDLSAAAPVRSLWQTNSHALKLTIELDWAVLRTGACQRLNTVAW